MAEVLHYNYPDDEGKIYCRQKNTVQVLDWDDCLNCPLFEDDINGEAVSCKWNEPDSDHGWVDATDAQKEYNRVNHLDGLTKSSTADQNLVSYITRNRGDYIG